VDQIYGIAATLGDTSIMTLFGDSKFSGIGYSSKALANPPPPPR
jgi:hypothetical protein